MSESSRHRAAEDALLVQRVRAGESGLFASLLEHHYDRALRLCRNILSSGTEAEDVVQDAVLLAFLNLDRLREPESFGAWFCSIAANRARDSIRRNKSVSGDFGATQGPLSTLADSSPSPEDVRYAREVHDLVLAAIYRLSDVNRGAVIGYYIEGYTYRELSELLGVPLSTVKGRLHKGRRQLEPLLAPLADEMFAREDKERKMDATSEARVVVEEVVRVEPHNEVGEEKMRRSATGWIGQVNPDLSMEADAVVMKEPETDRIFVVYVGTPEGNSIRVSLAGEQTPRPMSHDLMENIFGEVGISVTKVVISRLAEDTFYASISFSQNDCDYSVDSRPSDAIALAMRAEAPIFVTESVLEEASHRSRNAWFEWQREESGMEQKK